MYSISHGALPACDLKDYADTSCILTELNLNPRTKWSEKEGHRAAVTGEGAAPPVHYGIMRVLGFRQAQDGDLKLEIIPDASGKATGIANVTPGAAITLANFAQPESGTDIIHGFQRDNTKLLMARDPKRALSAEKVPTVDLSFNYFPHIAAPTP